MAAVSTRVLGPVAVLLAHARPESLNAGHVVLATLATGRIWADEAAGPAGRVLTLALTRLLALGFISAQI